MLAEAAHEIGLPKGVLNIVSGPGRVVGEAIVVASRCRHGELHRIARGRPAHCVGGRRRHQEGVARARRQVRVRGPGRCAVRQGDSRGREQLHAELRADLLGVDAHARAARAARRGGGAGQGASSPSSPLGDPFDKNTRLGPLASAGQRDTVLGFIEKGKKEGATLVAGGGSPAQPPKGFYVEPTIFANVDNRMTIAQEEIFGPVLAIIPYDTEEEAVRIANDSPYGLAGGVWAARRSARSPWRGSCAPGRSTSTADASTCWRRLAATRSRASAARLVRSRSKSSSS